MPRVSKRRQTSIVYAMTNAADSNEVVAFRRRANGTLVRVNTYATGGSGTGVREVSQATPQDGIDPLASQGSLSLSRDGRFLFAVNAGSSSISSFRVLKSGALVLADVEPSGGAQPNSLDAFGNLLYVSNVGDAFNSFDSNVTGFRVESDGRLTRIISSTRSLSTVDAQPARVIFSPTGRQLVVSELTTNRLSVFLVNGDGTLMGPTVNNSSGGGPFGSYFLSSGLLLVSEAGSNALSSYTVDANGTTRVISSSIPSGGMATCWVVASRDENFAYASNTDSGTITTYRISSSGTLAFVRTTRSVPQGMSAGPIDSGVSSDGRNFYVLNGAQGTISAFRIRGDGRLVGIQVVPGLPALGAQGLAVH